MKNHNKNVRTQKLSRKKLTQQEYLTYEQIGMVDESQDWLELFTPARINDLFVIMESCSDNQLKAKQIQKELKGLGFETVGEGTNILAMTNPLYPGACFKIALDDGGLADNHNESVLEDMVNSRLPKPRYNHVLAKHPSGIVSVQEFKVAIKDQDRMDEFRGSILKTLMILAKDFLIVDLSPNDHPLNYGVDRNGDWCFIDASDLYPLENLPTKIRCTKAVQYDDKRRKVIRCGGKLQYSNDFSVVYCPVCRGTFLPSEIKPKEKEDKMMNAMSDGMSQKEREEMTEKQLVRIGGRMKEIVVDVPDKVTEEKAPEPPKERIGETTDQILGRFKKPEARTATVVRLAGQEAAEENVPEPDPDETGDVEGSGEEYEEDVEQPTVHEPAEEFVADLDTIGKTEPADEDDDDEDDEEEPHLVNTIDTSETPETDDDGEDDDDDEEIDILYSIVTDDTHPNWGINMKLVGDPRKALEELAMPIRVWLDDKEYYTAINVDQMKNLLRPAVEAMLEDRER